LIKGKKWLLLSRWRNLHGEHRGDLNELFRMNRRVFKAYLLKPESGAFCRVKALRRPLLKPVPSILAVSTLT